MENKMSLPVNSYCRLCAEMKPITKLIDLEDDDQKHRETVEKLCRLNAGTDLSEETLPKTVCFVCSSNLDSAFEFVLGVEKAQSALRDMILVQQIKKEVNDAFSDDDCFDTPDEIKDENINVKEENEDQQPVLRLERSKKRRKKKIKRNNEGLDAIPLSQLKLTWKDFSWRCSYCDTDFITVEELKTHSIQFHDTCNAFRCTDCNVRKLRLDSFLIHVKRHRKYLKLSCYKCFERFSTPAEVDLHKMQHKSTELICFGCNSNFLTNDELNEHVNSFYQTKKKRNIPLLNQLTENLTCTLCKKTFRNKGSLSTHILIHTDRKRDHTCEKCGKCFLNKQNLSGHMILHENVRPYQCEICKSSFKTSTQLRSHVGVHDNKKPFACDKCGKCFRLQKQLTSHSIIHTDSLPHICSYCNKSFRFRTILNQHIRQHTGIKPYSCEICQRDFTNWPNYNKHMKRRHGMDMAKKKHTPEGVYPIDPRTGEVIMYPETNKTLEWKRMVMQHRRPGRPKVNLSPEDLKISDNQTKEVATVENQDLLGKVMS